MVNTRDDLKRKTINTGLEISKSLIGLRAGILQIIVARNKVDRTPPPHPHTFILPHTLC